MLRLLLTVPLLCLSLVGCSGRAARSSGITATTLIPTPTLRENELDSVFNMETMESGLSSVRRFKVRFDAGYREPSGNLVRILSGTGQFESRGENSEPLSYLWMHLEGDSDPESSIEIFFTRDKVLARGMGLGDHWIGMTVEGSEIQGVPENQGNTSPAMDDSYRLLVAMARIPGLRDVNFYPETGLALSGGDRDEGWVFFGESTLDGQTVFQYRYRSVDGEIWDRVIPSILQDVGIIQDLSTELWVGAFDGYPYRIYHTLDLSLGILLEFAQIEINIYPYDFNEPLNLPSDLPQYP